MYRLLCAGLLVLFACPASAQTSASPSATPQPTPTPANTSAVPIPVSATVSSGSSAPSGSPASDDFDNSKYVKPTWASLIETMAGFKALDYKNDPQILDDYALVTECDMYSIFHADEFKWQQARQGIMQTLDRKALRASNYYQYDVNLQLDQYDFRTQMFHFAEKSRISNINSFMMISDMPSLCGHHKVVIPYEFRAVLSLPISIQGIPMSPEKGEALLHQMREEDNTNRVVYAQFNLHVTYIEHLTKPPAGSDLAKVHYVQGGQSSGIVQIGAELTNAQIFSDPEHTKLIYTFVP